MNISSIYNSPSDIPGGVYTESTQGSQELALIVTISAHI